MAEAKSSDRLQSSGEHAERLGIEPADTIPLKIVVVDEIELKLGEIAGIPTAPHDETVRKLINVSISDEMKGNATAPRCYTAIATGFSRMGAEKARRSHFDVRDRKIRLMRLVDSSP